MSEEDPRSQGLETAPTDFNFLPNSGSDLEGTSDENEEIATKLCLTARKMDEMLDYMIAS